jgi:hypothetical protein
MVEVTCSNHVGRAKLRRIYDFMYAATPEHYSRNSLSYEGRCLVALGVHVSALLFGGQCVDRETRRSAFASSRAGANGNPVERQAT